MLGFVFEVDADDTAWALSLGVAYDTDGGQRRITHRGDYRTEARVGALTKFIRSQKISEVVRP